jgi:hypothetical protein
MKNLFNFSKNTLSAILVIWVVIMLTIIGKTHGQVLTIAITHVDSVQCYAASNGNIYSSPNAGTAPYTYVWSTNPPQYTQNAISIPAGTYTVTITDAAANTASTSTTVYQPSAINVSITAFTPILCYGLNNGTATVSISGGTPPYTYYNWDDGETTASANNLNVGTHTVTVTDHNGCTQTTSVIITQPAQINIILTPDSVSCYGHGNGSILANVTGGTPNYTYIWSNMQTAGTATNLVAGIYTVTVTDHNGCTANSNATVLQPTQMNSIVTNADTILACNGDNNGTITITATGGTPPLTYHWSTGASGITINNLPGGYHHNGGIYTYTDTITDHNGCAIIRTVNVYQPTALYAHLDSFNVQCLHDCNGQVSSYVTGGTAWQHYPFYSYLWSTGDTSASINGLCAGIYSLTVTDSNGCQISMSTTVGVNNIVIANFTMYPDTTIPHHYFISNNSTIDTANIYTWSWGDGTFDHTAYPTHTYSAAGFYTICLTIQNGVCTSTYCDSSYLQKGPNSIISVEVIPGTSGINSYELSDQIKIYPNPVADKLTIESPQRATIEIFNMEGQVIKIIASNNKAIINVSTLPNGLYFVKVKTEKGIFIKKFVKE